MLVAAFIAGGLSLYALRYYVRSRRWSPRLMRTDRAVHLLKTLVAQSWDEVDVDGVGWLEPFEARVVFSRVLERMENPEVATAIARAIAPTPTSAASSSAPATPKRHAYVDQAEAETEETVVDEQSGPHAVAPSSPPSPVAPASSPPAPSPSSPLISELRSLLQSMSLRLHSNIHLEFLGLLDHVDARPSGEIKTFTPPIVPVPTSGSKKRTRRRSGNVAAAVAGAGVGATSGPASASASAAAASPSAVSPVTHSPSSGRHDAERKASDTDTDSTSFDLDLQQQRTARSASSPPASSSSPGHMSAAAAALGSTDYTSASTSSSIRPSMPPRRDMKIFRQEFNTALVTWIEAQMMKEMYDTNEQG